MHTSRPEATSLVRGSPRCYLLLFWFLAGGRCQLDSECVCVWSGGCLFLSCTLHSVPTFLSLWSRLSGNNSPTLQSGLPQAVIVNMSHEQVPKSSRVPTHFTCFLINIMTSPKSQVESASGAEHVAWWLNARFGVKCPQELPRLSTGPPLGVLDGSGTLGGAASWRKQVSRSGL